MPLIIIPAICKERGSPFGAADACFSRGIAYASLSLAVNCCLTSTLLPAENHFL